MTLPPLGTVIKAVAGVAPAGVARQYGLEAAAALCAAAGAGVLLLAAWVEMAAAWGEQPARLAVAGLLAAAALGAHLLAGRRRRQAEAEAARARAALLGQLGLAQALLGARAAGLAPLAAFAAAFLMARRR